MSRNAVFLLILWAQVLGSQLVGAQIVVEQPVEGFARILSASRQAPYASNRGIEVISSYEYARDGTQSVVWESATVPQEYSQGFVTFVWSCGLARQQDTHELYVNDEKILGFSSGLIYKPTSWQEGDATLRFDPLMKDLNGEVHGVMYLRLPAAEIHPGEPVQLKVVGSAGNGAWFMLHHFEDTYAKSATLVLASGRRLVIPPTKSVFRALGPIGWRCVLVLAEGEEFPAEVFRLQARLMNDPDEGSVERSGELSVEREIRIETGQQRVELALWSAAQVPAGDWETELAFSQDGVDLQRWQGQIAVRDLHELDIRADWPAGSLAGSLGPALKVAGVDWSRDYLRGYLGSAFSFSMKKDGKLLWQDSSDEQYLSPQVTEFLEHTTIDVTRFESKSVAEAEAWDKVRGAIDEGYPAVVRMRDTGNHTLPGPWGLIVGYDEEMGTYTIHNAGYGAFTARRYGFADAEPGYWTRIMIFQPQTSAPDVVAASRKAIQHAIESSQGKHPGTDAPAHGLAAWQLWLDAFRQGTVDLQAAGHHAGFLLGARQAAARYLRQIESGLPSSARPPVLAAAGSYDQIVIDMGVLARLCTGPDPDVQQGAEILSRALEAERAALASLRRALATQ